MVTGFRRTQRTAAAILLRLVECELEVEPAIQISRSKVTYTEVQKLFYRTNTHTGPIAQPGPLKWPVINSKQQVITY